MCFTNTITDNLLDNKHMELRKKKEEMEGKTRRKERSSETGKLSLVRKRIPVELLHSHNWIWDDGYTQRPTSLSGLNIFPQKLVFEYI